VKSNQRRLPKTRDPVQYFLKVVHDLRAHCPWDKKQTHKSLVKYLFEEAYETADAIEHPRHLGLCEELGDLLLQVALHAEIASERGEFDFRAVARSISKKMIRRHPHVYGKLKVGNIQTHLKNWTRFKEKENSNRYLLDGIPTAMPALQLAERYGEIAASVGFDWRSVGSVLEKVGEEWAEFERALKHKRRKHQVEEEMGDVLFTLCQLTRHLGLDAERALRKSSLKFRHRFRKMEGQVRKKKRRMTELSPGELDKLWTAVKR